MLFEQVREALAEENPDALFMDGFDEAIIGIGRQYSKPALVVYDRSKCIEILARDMEYEEAEEYFQFNCECAWFGEHTPLIVDTQFHDL
jgi:hypothetical protein